MRVTLHLILIVDGNDVDTRHGGPTAPTVSDDALFELGALDVRPVTLLPCLLRTIKITPLPSSISAKVRNVTLHDCQCNSIRIDSDTESCLRGEWSRTQLKVIGGSSILTNLLLLPATLVKHESIDVDLIPMQKAKMLESKYVWGN
jgi:hypothetical protein